MPRPMWPAGAGNVSKNYAQPDAASFGPKNGPESFNQKTVQKVSTKNNTQSDVATRGREGFKRLCPATHSAVFKVVLPDF
eukprot:2941737-Heterocapsa_arctica.AAC.1